MKKDKITWTYYNNKSYYSDLINLFYLKDKNTNDNYNELGYIDPKIIGQASSAKDLNSKCSYLYSKIAISDNMDKYNQINELLRKYDIEIEDYCVKHKIFFTDYDHHNFKLKAVPVINNKYVMEYCFDDWRDLMRRVWERILGIKLYEEDFLCKEIPFEIREVKNYSS